MGYYENKAILERNFPMAASFIDNLENRDRIHKGFNIGTHTNLHYYLYDWFLFRIEFPGFDAIKVDYKRRKIPNREIKSLEFLEAVKRIVKNSSSKSRPDFYQDAIIIRKINSEYLNLLNLAIDEYYNQLVILKE